MPSGTRPLGGAGMREVLQSFHDIELKSVLNNGGMIVVKHRCENRKKNHQRCYFLSENAARSWKCWKNDVKLQNFEAEARSTCRKDVVKTWSGMASTCTDGAMEDDVLTASDH